MIGDIKKLLGVLDAKTRHRVPISIGLSFIVSLLEALGIGIVFPFLVVLSDPSAISKYKVFQNIDRWVGAGTQEMLLVILGITMVGLFVVKNILMIFVSWWQASFLMEGEANLSIRLVERYSQASYLDISGRNSAELIRNVLNVVTTAVSAFLLAGLSLVTELATILLVGVVVFVANPLVAIGVVLFFSIAAMVLYKRLHRQLGQLGKDHVDNDFHVLRTLREGLGAAKEMRVLNRENFFVDSFAKYRMQLGSIRTSEKFLNSLGRPYLEIVMVLGVGIVAVLVLSAEDKAQTVGVLGLLGVAGLRVMPSVNRGLVLVQHLRLSMPAVGHVLAEFKDVPEPAPTCGATADTKPQGIHIQGVRFSYPNRPESALGGIDLDIPWGRSLGLVGGSGAGKSTLVDVMLGLLKPQSGGVFVDGRNIHEDLGAWRARVGYVPQNIYLTDGSVRANIALGVPLELVDENRVAQAMRLAYLDEVILSLPQGIDTVIGEEGVRLSGGQRQRIGIARALYNDPDVLIFDEATSALDNETEYRISQMIKECARTKTIIIIAHRLSTIRHCDKVVLLQQGNKKAEGSFDVLKTISPEFSSLLSKGAL